MAYIMIQELQILATSLSNKKKCEIKIEDHAKNAGLQDFYDTAYAVLSGTIHASIRSLQEAVVLTEDNEIASLKNEPEIEDFKHLSATAIEVMLYAVKAVGSIFMIDVSDFTSKTLSELKSLIEEDR